MVNPKKRLGLISQIPHYPAGYAVEDVLRTAFDQQKKIQGRMRELEDRMTEHTPKDVLMEYDRLTEQFSALGGYDMDVDTDKVCNGLGIPSAMRNQAFDRLSGGEKTRVNLARLILEKTDILLLDEPTNHLDLASVEWLEDYINQIQGHGADHLSRPIFPGSGRGPNHRDPGRARAEVYCGQLHLLHRTKSRPRVRPCS